MPRKFWTEEENKLMRDLYPDIATKKLAKKLGRSHTSITKQAHILGIKKSDKFYKSPASGRLDGIIGAKTRFKKGNVSPNKGKKIEDFMPAEAIEKWKGNWFKKGDTPHNTKFDGHEYYRSDGYWYIRVEGVYVQKQRHIWEQEHGKIPPAHNVFFKDGNNENFAPDNLELVSNADLMRKNWFHPDTVLKRFIKVRDPELMEEIKQYHPQLIEVVSKSLKLKMKINEKRRD